MRLLRLLCAALLFLASPSTFLVPLAFAQAYDSEALCGRDENGYPLQCAQPGASENLESACLTTARLENCLPYHQTSCQIRGFELACRVYAIGSNCYGGDPNQCNYYMALLQANRACALDNDPNACTWMRQQGF